MDDRVLALCELSNDLLYHKIPLEKLPYYVDNSLAAGRTAAEEFKGREIKQLYRENKIEIEYFDKSSERFGVSFRGQSTMSKKGCKVELYRSSVKELARHSCFNNEKVLDYETALQVHLAHEFFHFLEYQRDKFVSDQLDTIQTMKLLFFTRTVHINRCSEIAAHAFAEVMIGLPVLPNFYDYLYLMDTAKMTQKSFDAMIENNGKILSQYD